MLFSLLEYYLDTDTALKISQSVYCFIISISHGVENYLPRMWGTGISDAIFIYLHGRECTYTEAIYSNNWDIFTRLGTWLHGWEYIYMGNDVFTCVGINSHVWRCTNKDGDTLKNGRNILTWVGISPSAGNLTQFLHIFITRSSLIITISCVQYCTRHGLLVNTDPGTRFRNSSVMHSGI